MGTIVSRATFGCLITICLIWGWPSSKAASADRESPSCRLVVQALDAASKLRVGMLRADIERDFDIDGGMSVQDHGTFTYRTCHYIKIDVEFKVHENSAATYPFPPEDEVSKISRPYLAYPVSD